MCPNKSLILQERGWGIWCSMPVETRYNLSIVSVLLVEKAGIHGENHWEKSLTNLTILIFIT